jgi:hypothetical protein
VFLNRSLEKSQGPGTQQLINGCFSPPLATASSVQPFSTRFGRMRAGAGKLLKPFDVVADDRG